MSALLGDQPNWSAMREWLIKARADAQRFARANRGYPSTYHGFEAQVEIVSAALDMMDEIERQALR